MISNARVSRPTKHDAESIAIGAISFLAGHPEEFNRFLALSGIDLAALRQSAEDPAFLGGILDFLLQDEPLLLVFAEQSGIDPATIGAARRHLNSAPPDESSF